MCSDAVDDYVGAVTDLTCELLDLMAEGMWVPDKTIFSRLIRDVQSDSLLRLNHYPPLENFDTLINGSNERIGFGEHSDPQILTILRSNDVGGLQISMPDGLWVPVHPDPNAFYVMVGDALQVGTHLLTLSSFFLPLLFKISHTNLNLYVQYNHLYPSIIFSIVRASYNKLHSTICYGLWLRHVFSQLNTVMVITRFIVT